MESFHCSTLMVAVFPNVCLWRRSLCSDLVLTLKNCIEPPSYARTAYVVAIWPSFLFDSFVKIWATCEMFLGKWFTAPPAKNFPYAYVSEDFWKVVAHPCSNIGETIKRNFVRNELLKWTLDLKNLTHPVCIARSRSPHALHSPFSGPPKIRVL